MLSRFQSVLPWRQGLSNSFPFRQTDRNDIFVITNNTPQRVNRIQVRSPRSDAEPEREPRQPNPGGIRWLELPIVDGLREPIGNDEGHIQPHSVQIELPDEQNDPTNTEPHDQPEQRNCHGGHLMEDDIRVEQPEAGEHGQPVPESPGAVASQVEFHSIPTFLKTHFDMMYYLGISPINGDGNKGTPVQLVVFSMVTMLALLFTFSRCKLFIVDEAKSGDLQDYVSAWYYISRIVLQLGFLCLVIFRRSQIASILEDTNANMPGIRYKLKHQKISHLSVVFASLGIIAALVDALNLADIISGNLTNVEQYILDYSHGTSLLLFLWNKETNGTGNVVALISQYGEELNATTMSMGIFGMVMTLVGNLQENAVKDILLMSALHALRLGKIFQSNMIQASNENQANDQLTSKLRNIHSHLSEMASQIESCFGNFFKLVHAQNLLFCGYLLAYLLDDDVNGAYAFLGTVKLLKIVFILYCPTNAIETSLEVKAVIRKKYVADDCPHDVNMKNAMLLLQSIEECPISIGRGNFLVDETFSLKFMGAVVTFFFFLMETDKETQSKSCR